ncbi:MAG: sugar porter family MFS transporter [Chitinophagaceae bacterium]
MKTYVILIAAVAALGGLLFGFDTAVIAGTLQNLRQTFALSNSALGLVVAATSIGCIPGALIAGRMSDRFGRKKIMILTSLLYIVAAIGSAMAGGFNQLVEFRFVGGIAIGMASTIIPIYISEIAPPGFRGRLGMLQQLAIVLGILISFISNYLIAQAHFTFLHTHQDWRYMLGAAFIPSLIFFILLLLVPESPRWLVLKDRIGQARAIFSKIFSPGEADQQIVLVTEERAREGASSLGEVFSHRFRKLVLIGLIFASIAQLTGINIVFYYAPLIFEKTKVGGSVLFQTLLTGIVNLIFTLIAFALIDRVGRKKLLLGGSTVMGICMFIIGWLFLKNQLQNYFVLTAVFVYIAGFACSWGAVLWVYVAEIFPNKIRGTATSIAVFGNWVANTLVSLSFPLMLSRLGGADTFFIYAAFNFSMIFFVSRYIFETKGVPLENMEQLYLGLKK